MEFIGVVLAFILGMIVAVKLKYPSLSWFECIDFWLRRLGL